MSGDIVELKAMMASSPATNATSKVDLNLNGNHNLGRGDSDVDADGIYTEIDPNKQEKSIKTQQDVSDGSENIASNNNYVEGVIENLI